MTLEERIRKAVQIANLVYPAITVGQIAHAVVDQDADGDGRLDANPDTGAGSEAGTLTVAIGPEVVDEAEFGPYKTALAATSLLLDKAVLAGLTTVRRHETAMHLARLIDEGHDIKTMTTDQGVVVRANMNRDSAAMLHQLEAVGTIEEVRALLGITNTTEV